MTSRRLHTMARRPEYDHRIAFSKSEHVRRWRRRGHVFGHGKSPLQPRRYSGVHDTRPVWLLTMNLWIRLPYLHFYRKIITEHFPWFY